MRWIALGLALFGCATQPAALPITEVEIERCRVEMQAAGDPGHEPGAPRPACAELQARLLPRCGDAIRAAATAPIETRTSTVLAACRDAYCPTLPEPRPDLCTNPMAAPGAPQLAQAGELFTAIYRAEGVEAIAARVTPQAAEAMSELPRFSASPASPVASPELVVTPLPDGARLTVGERSLDLPTGAPANEALTTLLGPAEGRSFVVAVHPDVSFLSVQALNLASRELGFVSIDMRVLERD